MEYMVRPENIARLTVTHKPTMFKYKDLVDDRRFLSVCVWGGDEGFVWNCRKTHILACPKVLQEM